MFKKLKSLFSNTEPKRTGILHIPAKKLEGLQKQDLIDPFRPRQGSEEDPQLDLYTRYGLLEPPYSFSKCWQDYEQSDMLTACIDSIVRNCERPHELEYVGDEAEKDSDIAKEWNVQLSDFFRRVNEKHSFFTLRKKIRLEREVTGNAFVEVMRGISGGIDRLYYLPGTNVRIARLEDDQIPISVQLPRNGRLIQITAYKRFRRFARVLSVAAFGGSSPKVQWYKEMGDPRILNSKTGDYVTDATGRWVCDDRRLIDPKLRSYVRGVGGAFATFSGTLPNVSDRATEIWWFRDTWGGNAYGIPRWISTILDVRARYAARWLNNNLLDSGGTPKGIVMFQGTISPETQDHIRSTLEEWATPEMFNQWVLLNVEPDAFGFDLNTGKGNSTKPEFINLDRTEDYMFKEFLGQTARNIRGVYRLPPIVTGATDDYTNATAYASLEVAESQVFEPIRYDFDERINTELIQNEFGIHMWQFKTQGTRIGDKETFYRAVGMWSRAGLSWNQMIQLGNQMLGVQLSQREGPVWDLPFEVVKGLIRTGNYEIVGNDLMRVIDGEITPIKEDRSVVESIAASYSASDDARDLIDALARIETREIKNYEAPEIDATHNVL